MPDEATVRDVAQKLERWAASLPDEERTAVQRWMTLDASGAGSVHGTVWWFEPSSNADRPSAREAG